MPEPIIKATIKEKIIDRVTAVVNRNKSEDKAGTEIFITKNDFEPELGLDDIVLGKYLAEFKSEGLIVEDITFIIKKLFKFKVKFLGIVQENDKPRFFYSGSSVKVTYKGKTRIVGRKGNLKAELAYEMGQNWGYPRSRSAVINSLKECVKNKKTKKFSMEAHIDDFTTQVKEINRTLTSYGIPAVKLVELQDPTKPFHARWKFMLKINSSEPDIVVIYESKNKRTRLEKIKKAFNNKLKN